MNSIIETLLTIAALLLGSAVGYSFGAMQNAARIQNKKISDIGKLKSNWKILPGSFGRISLLLIILALIQLSIPMLFKGSIQWIVSLGILLGYGWSFVRKLKQRTVYKN